MKEEQHLNEKFSYDVIGYPSFIIPQTHPDSLAVIAKLYGLNSAPAEKCRVLELGCADGTNLNWLAYGLPESEFVGVDLAKSHIDDAEKNKVNLELQNVSFFQQNVLDITEETFGKFDYIIAHGLFSWVPDFVRQKILGLYEELLNPNGVGFISYNVYPGCYRRQIVQDMIKFHTQKFENPLDKIHQGVAFIDFLAQNTTNSSVYHEMLKYELEGFSRRTLENIYHDDLSEINQPFYFTEFISAAEKYNLKFLSETDYLSPQRNNMSEEAIKVFEDISQNTIEYEQYSDFLKCRRFRQTLLCKSEAVLETEIDPAKVKEFYISSLLTPASPTIDLNPDSSKEFLSKKGEKVNISHVLTKLVLADLVGIGSHPVQFNKMIETANALLQSQGFLIEDLEKESEITASILLRLFSPNAIRFHSTKSNFPDQISEKPIISKFARWQLTRNDFVNNFYGGNLNIQDGFLWSLLSLLDGTRTREALTAELTNIVTSYDEMDDKETFIANIPEIIDQNLFVLAKMGFLIG